MALVCVWVAVRCFCRIHCLLVVNRFHCLTASVATRVVDVALFLNPALGLASPDYDSGRVVHCSKTSGQIAYFSEGICMVPLVAHLDCNLTIVVLSVLRRLHVATLGKLFVHLSLSPSSIM